MLTERAGPGGPRTDTFGYDAGVHTAARALAGQSAQMLSSDVEGHLGSVVDAAGTTSYLYDAAGGRLIRRDPTGTTLYLAGPRSAGQDRRIERQSHPILHAQRSGRRSVQRRRSCLSAKARMAWAERRALAPRAACRETR